MREFLENEIKVARWNIRETREYIDDLKQKLANAIRKGNREDINQYEQYIVKSMAKLNEEIRRLNDLKREWRYLDREDDYLIHKETLDELAGLPRVSEAILILYH